MSQEWYILYTRPNQELAVGLAVKDAVPGVRSVTLDPEADESVAKAKVPYEIPEFLGEQLEGVVTRIEVPSHQVKEKGRLVMRRLYPRYVYIQMEYGHGTRDAIIQALRVVEGIVELFGGWETPQPLSAEEGQVLLKQVGEVTVADVIEFGEGDLVRILEGAFQDYTGKVQDINAGKRTLRVSIPIFGKETPVEVEIDKVVSV